MLEMNLKVRNLRIGTTRNGMERVSSYRGRAIMRSRIMRYSVMTCTLHTDIKTTPLFTIVIVTSPAPAWNRINHPDKAIINTSPPPRTRPYTSNNSSDTHPATSYYLAPERETSVYWKHLLKSLSAVVLAYRPRAVNTRSPRSSVTFLASSSLSPRTTTTTTTEQDVELLLR
jgi:hypothetical protein